MKSFDVLVSETAARQLSKLDEKIKNHIRQHLLVLKENPAMPRSGADIKKLKGFDDPQLYRLRIGDFRAIYAIQENQVKVTEIMRRSKGYAWLD